MYTNLSYLILAILVWGICLVGFILGIKFIQELIQVKTYADIKIIGIGVVFLVLLLILWLALATGEFFVAGKAGNILVETYESNCIEKDFDAIYIDMNMENIKFTFSTQHYLETAKVYCVVNPTPRQLIPIEEALK